MDGTAGGVKSASSKFSSTVPRSEKEVVVDAVSTDSRCGIIRSDIADPARSKPSRIWLHVDGMKWEMIRGDNKR